MKFKYKYLILLIAEIAILLCIILSKYELSNSITEINLGNKFYNPEEELVEYKDELEITDVIPLDTKFPLNTMYKVKNGHGNLYTLSYRTIGNKLEVGSKIKFKEYASDQLYYILRKSYPNVTLKEMGVNTEQEAYQAIQLALWEIAERTGEAAHRSELSYIRSIRKDMGIKNINSKVFEKAESLVRTSENLTHIEKDEKYEQNLVPTLIFNTESVKSDAETYEEYGVMGPYYYRVTVGNLKNVIIDTTDTSGNILTNVEIIDANGIKIKNFIDTNEFYVKFPKNIFDEIEEITITVKTDVIRIVPAIYEDDYSDYILNTYIKNHMELSAYINLHT